MTPVVLPGPARAPGGPEAPALLAAFEAARRRVRPEQACPGPGSRDCGTCPLATLCLGRAN